MLAHIEPFWSWHTPIAWTGYIFFIDGVIWHRRGESPLRNDRAEMVFLARRQRAALGHLRGIQQVHALQLALRRPARDAARPLRRLRLGVRDHLAGDPRSPRSSSARSAIAARRRTAASTPSASRSTRSAWTSMVGGRADAARCRSCIRRRGWRRRSGSASSSCSIRSTRMHGAESLRGDLRAQHPWRLINLLVAGLVCGLLWEFWNYWAHTKWIYTVPMPPDLKLFEMPLPGYLGFPAFAVECFVMYVFVRLLVLAWLVAADRTIISRFDEHGHDARARDQAPLRLGRQPRARPSWPPAPRRSAAGGCRKTRCSTRADEPLRERALRAARAHRERQEPPHLQGSGSAVADEAPRGARDRRRRRRRCCCASSRSSASTSGSATRNTAKSSRTRT